MVACERELAASFQGLEASTFGVAFVSLYHPLVKGVQGDDHVVVCALVVASLLYPLEVHYYLGLVACVLGMVSLLYQVGLVVCVLEVALYPWEVCHPNFGKMTLLKGVRGNVVVCALVVASLPYPWEVHYYLELVACVQGMASLPFQVGLVACVLGVASLP